MNKELYDDILNKLNSLSPEDSTPQKIRGLLVSWSNRILIGDKITVLCAFYNYMNGKKDFEFLNDAKGKDWSDYFRSNFSNYFNIYNIKRSFDDIIFDEKMVDLILKFARENVVKEFYDYASMQNAFYMKNNNTKYKDVFEKLQNKGIDLGLFEKQEKETTAPEQPTPNHQNENPQPAQLQNQFATASEIRIREAEIQSQMDLLRAKSKKIEEQKEEKRETLFSSAADAIGISQEELIQKVGNGESYNVDNIVVDPRLVNMLRGDDSKVASVPKGMYGRMKDRISTKRKLKLVELDLAMVDGLSTLTLSKKDTIFDKIANTSREVLQNIKKSAIDKALTIAAIGSIGKEVLMIAISNTNERIKARASEIKASGKEVINDAKKKAEGVLYNAVIGLGTAQMNAEDFIDDQKEKIDLVKQSAATKTAEKLRSFADRIEPSSDIVIEEKTTEKPKETQTYINTPQGKAKIVLRAATKAGEMPVKEELSHSL